MKNGAARSVLLLATGGLLCLVGASATAAEREAMISCPPSVVSSFGGFDRWSQIEVQANFVRALVAPNGLLTCQYGFGRSPPAFFGIQRPCPSGHHCVAAGRGFRVTPGSRRPRLPQL